MNVLILTKTKSFFWNSSTHTKFDYISNDTFFSGWKSIFEKCNYNIYVDSRNTFLLDKLLLFSKFKTIYFFLLKVLRKTSLIEIERYLLSKSIVRQCERLKINMIFTELNDLLSIATLDLLKNKGVVTAQWFGVFPDMVPDSLLQKANHYQYLFLPGDYSDEFKKVKITRPCIKYIGSMINTDVIFQDSDEKYAFDICFIGGVGMGHEDRIKLLEKIAKKYKNFAFYGYGLERLKSESPLRVCYKGWANTQVMRKVFSSSKIAINLTLDDYSRVKKGFNIRLHEISACGGALQLVSKHKNINEFYDKTQVVQFSNTEELFSLIDYYLEHDKERRVIVNNAMIASTKYTFTNWGTKQLKQLNIFNEA